jgi:UDP-glucose 4-epimerase
MKKFLVGIIGGSGFLGSSLAINLSSIFDIKILDIKEPRCKMNKVMFTRCDVRDHEQVKKALKDVDLVIHTAIVQIPLINENKKLAYEVNFIGTHNVCQAVAENENIKGMILAGSWHTIGERELKGLINEEFGFRPDMVEDRARLYAFSKIAQECMVRYYDEMTQKIYGVIRMGTLLGENMPDKTAAYIFIDNGLKGKPITPFKHSMYRPMLYVDIIDVCRIYKIFAKKILLNKLEKKNNSLAHIVNCYYPEPITILELAEIVRTTIIEFTRGKIAPKIEVIDKGMPPLFNPEDKLKIRIDIAKIENMFGIKSLIHPRETIRRIVKSRLSSMKNF